MTVYNVTNRTQLNNAWTSADTDGDLIFIKQGQGAYDYTTGLVPTPDQVNGLHRNIQVIGYKDSYNASNATSDLDDIDAAWGNMEGDAEFIFDDYAKDNFPMIILRTTTTQPLIRLGPGWTARNCSFSRTGNGSTDTDRPVIRQPSTFGDATYINCRIVHFGNRTTDCSIDLDGCHASFYNCYIRNAADSITGANPRVIVLKNNAYISLVNCVISSRIRRRTLIRIVSSANVYAYKTIFRQGSAAVSQRVQSPENYLYLNGCTALRQDISFVYNAHNTPGGRAYYLLHNIVGDTVRSVDRNSNTSRPLITINNRRVEVSTTNWVWSSSRDKNIDHLDGGTLNNEFINYSTRDFRLKPDAQSVGKLTFNDNIGALPTEPRQFFSGSNNKSIRHGH